jgi:hypothetical protein
VKILIDPHGDDAALFAAYTCLRERPLVLVPLLSVPEEEVDVAMRHLGCVWQRCPLQELGAFTADEVFAPALEVDGLPEHNLVANMISKLYGEVTSYLTYAGHPRVKSRSGILVEPEHPWVWSKLRALACFESQAETPSWFHFQEDLREYLA